jgi:hypothetical protein
LGDFARLAVNGLGVPFSITAAHFRDVPRTHPAFRYIETLYDRSTSSGKAFFPFELRDFLNYRGSREAYAYPDGPLKAETARKIISGLLEREVSLPSALQADQVVTRAEAADWIASFKGPLER